MDCKKALIEANGDLDKAFEVLRKNGIAKAQKKSGRDAKEGSVVSYIHPGAKLGVLLELNCETDFVANTDDFKGLAREIALHIASQAPVGISDQDIPSDLVDREKKVYEEQVKEEGKPDHIADKIVEGKLRKFFEENTLLAQPFVKNPDQTIEELITEVAAKTGEKIEIARFVRMKVGEDD